MTWQERIAECNRHRLEAHRPLHVGDQRVGFVRRDRLALLADLAEAVVDDERGLRVRGECFASRSASFASLAARLVREGVTRRPTGELYPVARRARGEPLALVDRAAVPALGIASCGVHVNGYVRGPRGIEMWIATRARGKPVFPGLLDNVVAGGQPHGIGLLDNVVKECGEEAGIPPALARTARAVGVVSYVFEDELGLRPDTLFCFDLELPSDFVPRVVDGEVESFERLPIDEVAAIARDTTRFKFNCNLVILDFLVRHGLLDVEGGEYPALVAGLRTRLDA
ncbi:MAG: DUF4743 domain-containing protein [Planctomycetes bacterium]|nr:DUF4743 domain-containing protein [Planctomycetota bacterium]